MVDISNRVYIALKDLNVRATIDRSIDSGVVFYVHVCRLYGDVSVGKAFSCPPVGGDVYKRIPDSLQSGEVMLTDDEAQKMLDDSCMNLASNLPYFNSTDPTNYFGSSILIRYRFDPVSIDTDRLADKMRLGRTIRRQYPRPSTLVDLISLKNKKPYSGVLLLEEQSEQKEGILNVCLVETKVLTNAFWENPGRNLSMVLLEGYVGIIAGDIENPFYTIKRGVYNLREGTLTFEHEFS